MYHDSVYALSTVDNFRVANLLALNVDSTQWLTENSRVCQSLQVKQLDANGNVPKPVGWGPNNGGGGGGAGVVGGGGKGKFPAAVRQHDNNKRKAANVAFVGGGQLQLVKKPNNNMGGGAVDKVVGHGNIPFQYICLTDFFYKQDSVRFPKCPKDKQCNLRHMAKPAPGAFSPSDRAELVNSCKKLRKNQPELVAYILNIV